MMKSVPIELGGKMRNIRYNTNAICDIETTAGQPIMSVYRSGLVGVRMMLWGGMKWEEKGLTPNLVGLWLDDYYDEGGKFEELNKIILEALQNSGFYKSLTEDEAEQEEKND